MERYFKELGYAVVAELGDGGVNFSVHPGSTHQEPIFVGHIKKEGCSNWKLNDKHHQLHFCGKEEAVSFGVLLSELYDWSEKLLSTRK